MQQETKTEINFINVFFIKVDPTGKETEVECREFTTEQELQNNLTDIHKLYHKYVETLPFFKWKVSLEMSTTCTCRTSETIFQN